MAIFYPMKMSKWIESEYCVQEMQNIYIKLLNSSLKNNKYSKSFEDELLECQQNLDCGDHIKSFAHFDNFYCHYTFSFYHFEFLFNVLFNLSTLKVFHINWVEMNIYSFSNQIMSFKELVSHLKKFFILLINMSCMKLCKSSAVVVYFLKACFVNVAVSRAGQFFVPHPSILTTT